MKTLLALAILGVPSAVSAALPPLYTSIREIRLIIDSGQVQAELGSGNAITSIVATKKGYRITAGDCTLMAVARHVQQKDAEGRIMVGPGTIQLQVGKAECKKQGSN